jgi:hypothetical protein
MKAIDPTYCVSTLDDEVLAFDIPERAQPLSKRPVRGKGLFAAEVAKETDPVHLSWLLRPGGEERGA